jgi:N-acetylglutamate synthase-like GNAT family acetyltransferase
MSAEVTIRPARPEDASACGKICYDAFCAINTQHNFPADFPSVEVPIGILSLMFSNDHFYCVVAEHGGRIVGSNCLDERSIINGIGPVTVDPATQNLGIGHQLMQTVMDRVVQKQASGVRLVQAAFHNRSLSLYTRLGFDTREPLSCVQGRTTTRTIPGCKVRPATEDDIPACNALSHQIHGFDRSIELSMAIHQDTACVVERAGRITGYASALAFFGHATAEANTDLQALIASTESFGGAGILIPTRNSALLRWSLENSLRITQPMTLMSTGLYNDPAGAWLPSVLF